jgi:hypothetical protein
MVITVILKFQLKKFGTKIGISSWTLELFDFKVDFIMIVQVQEKLFVELDPEIAAEHVDADFLQGFINLEFQHGLALVLLQHPQNFGHQSLVYCIQRYRKRH